MCIRDRYLLDDYQDARREQSESRFRLNLLVVGAAVGAALLIQDPIWLPVTLILWTLLIGEIRVRWGQVSEDLTEKRIKEIEKVRSLAENRIAAAPPHKDTALLEKIVSDCKKLLAKLNWDQFRQGNSDRHWLNRLRKGPPEVEARKARRKARRKAKRSMKSAKKAEKELYKLF